MAGHFILKSITTSDLNVALSKGAQWSALQHGNIGWSTSSRATLSDALQGKSIGNRDNLPPHRYLILRADKREQLESYAKLAGWTDSLIRPSGGGLGLKSLDVDAQTKWNRGDEGGAVAAQLGHGNVSIEVYYQAGYEMT